MEGQISDKLRAILNDPEKAKDIVPAVMGWRKSKYFTIRRAGERATANDHRGTTK